MEATKIDLHVHTLASEGMLTLASQFAYAKGNGLACIAVTDRDLLPDVADGERCAAQYHVEYIPGIEITAGLDGEEVHILGYRIDPSHRGLCHKVDLIRQSRQAHVQIMLYKLNQHGIPLTLEDVHGHSPGCPGRVHIARALAERGYVNSLKDAFSSRLLGVDGECYYPSSRVSAEDIIALIADAGGAAVLAHPAVYHRRLGMGEEEIERLAEAGLGGIESRHPCHSPAMAERYERMAAKLGLFVTGGSGCRGVNFDPVICPRVELPAECPLPLRSKGRAGHEPPLHDDRTEQLPA